MIIKGYMSKQLFENYDFHIYSFTPTDEYKPLLSINAYGSITIMGEMPTLSAGKEYEIEIGELALNRGKESYPFERMVSNPMNMDYSESFSFLSGVLSEKMANNILNEYPTFIQMVMSGEEDKIDVDKVKFLGVKSLAKAIKKIKDNIKFFEISNEYQGYGLTYRQIGILYSMFSSFEMLKQKLDENPYTLLCSISGVGFKTADNKILKRDRERFLKSPFRLKECILYMLQVNEKEGNTWTSLERIKSQCKELVVETMHLFDNIAKNSGDIYYNEMFDIIARDSTYKTEKYICDKLLEMQKRSFKWDFDITKYNTSNGCVLTEQQKLILQHACENNVSILCGFSGAGKSLSSRVLVDMANDNGVKVLLLAPTGRASKVMTAFLGQLAKTIHRGLGCMGADEFTYGVNNTLPFGLIIVDETTMADIWLMKRLLEAIDINNTKIVFVGDPAQLASVGCGNVFQDLINSGKFKTSILDKVFRYNSSGLAFVAKNCREGNKFLTDSPVQIIGEEKDFCFIETEKQQIVNKVLQTYRRLIEKGYTQDEILVLSPFNVGETGTYALNKVISNEFNPPSENKKEIRFTVESNEIVIREGDMVMQTRNSYDCITYADFLRKTPEDELDHYPTFNGDTGIVKEINITEKGYDMKIDFDGIEIYFSKDMVRGLLLAYVVSVHKSQGSSYKTVISIIDRPHAFFCSRNMLYVAFTRCREFCCCIGSQWAIENSLKKAENMKRQTFLEDMLIQTQ